MKTTLWTAAVSAIAAGWLAAAEPRDPKASPAPPSSCIECHKELEGAAREPTMHVAEDVHFQRGLSCHDCHGGNPAAGQDGDIEAAHDERKAWKKPGRLEIPLFCARCHADAAFMKRFDPQERVDQLSEYRTSVHGKRNAAGDVKVAVCTDCHGVHPIQAVRDARSPVHPARVVETCGRCHGDQGLMGSYGLPSDQYAGYKSSVHARAMHEGGDLSAPTCNDCHGSHGAAPPGVQSVVSVCGSCHTREATLFREVEKRKRIDLTQCIQCMVCHDNHAVQAPSADMLGVGPKSTCIGCHPAGTPIHASIEQMATARDRLRVRFDEATGLLTKVEHAGIEVSADRVALHKAQDQLVDLRVLAHSFDREKYLAVANEGLASSEAGVTAAERGFKELRQRRLGLVVSLAVIVAVMIALFLKIRQLEGSRIK